MASLIDPNLKVERAKVHLDELNAQVRSFLKSEFYHLVEYDDLERQQYVLRLEVSDPPLYLGSIAGDFISCLRSSLDHLAWQLATLRTPRPPDNICFPIFGKNSPKTQEGIEKATQGIPGDAIALMESFQPYHHGDKYKLTYLWRLNKLWNIDKHRHITLHSFSVNFAFPSIISGTPCSVDNEGIMRFPLSAKKQVKFEPATGGPALYDIVPSGNVQFGSEKDGIILVIQDFFEIYEFVSQKVIPSFAGFFT